jgi:hypothetical protein
MSKLIRVNINLDNSHSLTDFPVDIYSGTTTGNATNLVYAGVTTSPVTFTVDDSIIEFGLKLVSTGCLDQVLLIESPSVDCEICADFVEFFNPAPTPQPTPDVTPQPTPNATPLSTPNATPNVTPNATPDATPLPTNGATPNPTSTPEPDPTPYPTATPVSTPTPTPACLCYRTIPYDGTMFVVYKDCDGNQVTINETCYSPNCQGIDFSATEIVSGQSDVFTIDCNEPTSTPNATPTSNCTNYTLVPDQGETTATFRWQECGSNEFSSWTGLSGDQKIVCAETGTVSVVSGYGSIFTGNKCNSDETPSPTPTTETTEISAILLSNTTSAPNNANCDEGNDGVIENRVFVLYNTTWFTTNASGKNVVKSTFSLTNNEIINGGDSSYTIHPDSIWTGGPSVFRTSSDGTYMIADSSTEGTEKLLFQKNGNYGTTNKCGGGRDEGLEPV